MKKKILCLGMLVAMSVAAVGCGKAETTTEETEVTTEATVDETDSEEATEEVAEEDTEEATETASNAGEREYTVEPFGGEVVKTIVFTLPEGDWDADEATDGMYQFRIYNVASAEEAYSNDPRMLIRAYVDEDAMNYYKDGFENLADVESREIGGVTFTGRSYKDVGMDWIEYYATLEDGYVLSIKISGIDLGDGTEGSDVLDSISFK